MCPVRHSSSARRSNGDESQRVTGLEIEIGVMVSHVLERRIPSKPIRGTTTGFRIDPRPMRGYHLLARPDPWVRRARDERLPLTEPSNMNTFTL